MPRDEAWDVPAQVRVAVLERDGHCCRVCGRWTCVPALHHIRYRSEGGDNSVGNLITVGWVPGEDCHISIAHANKALWQPVLTLLASSPGALTGFQVVRQLANGLDPAAVGLDEQVGQLAAQEWERRLARRARA